LRVCRHYFDWNETLGIVERIHTVLADGGLLLCLLNSTRDDNYGASGYPRIEDHF
jgi:hypothetical protein